MIKKENIKMMMEDEYEGKDTWRANLCSYDDDNYLFVDVNTDTVLAEATIIDDFSYMKIDCFEIRKNFRNLGLGKECVKLLMDFVCSIGKKGLTGDSVQDAVPFWSRLGADIKFPDECNDCVMDCDSCEYYDIDDLNEFLLKPNSFYSYYQRKY